MTAGLATRQAAPAAERVAAAVAGVVPGLTLAAAHGLVTQAASRRGALRQLNEHLAAHPGALGSGDAAAPLPVITLAGLLAAAGYHNVRVPRCAECAATAGLRHRIPGGRLCDDCYRRSRREPCAGCGRDRVVNKRTEQGPLCCSCAQPRKPCAGCGQLRRVTARRHDGAPLCKACHQPPERVCATCGQTAATYAHTPAGPVCRACYIQPSRTCGACGQERPVARRATSAEPDLCSRCIRWPLATCAVCGQQRRCNPRAPQPICLACRNAGHLPKPARPRYDSAKDRARHGTWARRVLPERLHTILAHPVHGTPAQLEPLITALTSTPNPGSVLDWVTRRSGGRLLRELASRAQHEPLTHELLDTFPQTPGLHHLRGVLVYAGVLPERAEYLDRIQPWLDQVLSRHPPDHARLVRPFALWHVLRRARARERRRGFTPSAARWARSHILIALEFLTWLGDCGTTLAHASQHDIDDWLHNATQQRYLLRAFIEWAKARNLTTGISVPVIPHTEPATFLDEPARWQLLTRCLNDTTIPLDVRTAGALLLLYGQFTSRLARFTAADFHHHGHDTYLRLDTVPVLLPPKLATLVCAQRDATPTRVTYRHASHDAQPLFPGRSPGQPIRSEALIRRLRQHGIEPRHARNGALAAWATELPAPILADVLGLNISTAERWAQRTRRDWTSYLAERARDPHHAHQTNPKGDNHAGNSAQPE